MDKIISQTKYSRRQHKQFYFFHLFHRGKTVKLLLFVIVAMLLMAILNTFKAEPDQGTIIFSWIIFGLTMSVTPLMMINRINSVVKQETIERKQSTDKIEVTKIKFTRTNDLIPGKEVFTWTDIEIICETDLYYYIYIADNKGIFIVKEDIKEGSKELFEKMALANLRKDKKGRPFYKRYGKVKKVYKQQLKLGQIQGKKNVK